MRAAHTGGCACAAAYELVQSTKNVFALEVDWICDARGLRTASYCLSRSVSVAADAPLRQRVRTAASSRADAAPCAMYGVIG